VLRWCISNAKNYAVVTEEEMTYVDGGGILIAGLVLCFGSTAMSFS